MAKKINLDDVKKWKEMRMKGYSLKEIGIQFRTSTKTISKYLKQEEGFSPKDSPKLNSNSTKGNSNSHSSSLENDPDILKMKKELEIAKLRRQIREEEAPLELEIELNKLEEQILKHRDWLLRLSDWQKKTNEWVNWVNNSIALTLENYKCQCGAQGKVGVYIKCTKCNNENCWGYFETDTT